MAFTRTAISVAANTTSGSTALAGISSTVGWFTGMLVYGTGIPADTTVVSFTANSAVLNRAATATATGVTVTAQYITQSGTDADPTGLAAMAGVTTISSGSGIGARNIYALGANQLLVTGTLTHDPDLYEITTGLQNGVISTGTYNFGVARTVNGAVAYSKGTGLSFTYPGGLASNFGWYQKAGGNFVWNGGIIKSAAPAMWEGGALTSNSFDGVWLNANPGQTQQFRCVAVVPTINALTLAGLQSSMLAFFAAGFNAATLKYANCAYQTPAGGGSNLTFNNPLYIGNQSTSDIMWNQTVNVATVQVNTVRNPDRLPVVTRLSANAKGDVPVYETMTFNVSSSSGAAAANVVGYIKDTDNGARLNTTANNYTADRKYSAVSTGAGVLSLGDVLVCAINDLPSSTTLQNYDYRSNFGNGSNDFNVYLGGYEFNPVTTRQTAIGAGGKTVAWTLFADASVTRTRTAALALLGTVVSVAPGTQSMSVLANASLDDLYDAAKAYKYGGTLAAVEVPSVAALLVSALGSVAAAAWSVSVASGCTLAAGTKFDTLNVPTLTNAGTVSGAVSISTLLTSAASGMAGTVALLSGARWDMPAPATLPTGSAAAGATVRITGSTGGVVDGRAFTWAGTSTLENTSGQPVTLKLRAGQQLPQRLATSGAITIDTRVAITLSGLDPATLGSTWVLGYIKDADYQARPANTAPAAWTGWAQTSGTGNSTTLQLPGATVYQLFLRAPGYEAPIGPIASIDTATQSVVTLSPVALTNSLGQSLLALAKADAATVTMAARFAYLATTQMLELDNQSGSQLNVSFLATFLALESLCKTPATAFQCVQAVYPNAARNGFVVPASNPLQWRMTAASTAGAVLLADVSDAIGDPLYARFRANPAHAWLLLPRATAAVSLTSQSVADVASAVLTTSRSSPLSANIVQVNSIAVHGEGTADTPWGP